MSKPATICPHCGAPDDDHGYEQMARYCYPVQIERLQQRVEDAEADAVRLHKKATDRWEALLELKCRDDRNGSLPPAYREIIDRALGVDQS